MKQDNAIDRDEFLGFRTNARIKQILQELADEVYRTLSQQCELAVTQWLKEHGYLPDELKKKS